MKGDGYRGMLRDRVPQTIDYALKWCKAKNMWVEHVYKNFINIYIDMKEREQATRLILGLRHGKPLNFNFHETIDWENLSVEDKVFWNWTENWIEWFKKMYVYIQNTYDLSPHSQEGDLIFIDEIKTKFLKGMDPLDQNQLAKYLLKCCKEGE